MTLKALQFLAVVLTALALVAPGAHLFALPNKIGLPQEQYFTVQAIYHGWALLGVILIGALLADLGLAVRQRDQRVPFLLALMAVVLMAASLLVFFTWTYPANQATANWTVAPETWQALRRQWEFAHATSALLQFLSLCSIVLSVLSWRR
jgi:sulfite exporter TauE/SafE